MKKSLYFLVLLPLLTSCFNDSLQNIEALEILKKEYKNPCVQTLISRTQANWDGYNIIFKNASELEDKGYVRMSTEHIRADMVFPATTLLKIEVLPKGKEFLVNSNEYRSGTAYAVATAQIVNIIGISQQENVATVRFTYTYQPTPLHSIRTSSSKRNSRVPECRSGMIEAETTFRKYDTGWRLE